MLSGFNGKFARRAKSWIQLMVSGQSWPSSLLRVVLPYLAFAVVWIILSDRVVLALAGDDILFATRLQSIKGLAFVITSSLVIAVSLWAVLRQKSAAERRHTLEILTYIAKLEENRSELENAYEGVIQAWAQALEMRDLETGGHTKRVTAMMDYLAEQFRFTLSERRLIRWGSLLHDIGKMGIPDRILLKPGSLNIAERKAMEKHPELAVHFLENVPHLSYDLIIPLYHHERWDGSGYPTGLKGEEIPLAARLFAVVDAADAMASGRPYRPPLSVDQVYQHLQEEAGHLYDPQVVKVFVEADVLSRAT
jgi:HD-GYP domain-containing protein (c-di-GMP phosphodiesterase class II)